MARSRVLFPAPEGPTTAVMLPAGTSASTPRRISVSPAAYPRPETLMPREPMLEHLPAQVGVEPVEDGVGVAGEGRGGGGGEVQAAGGGGRPRGVRGAPPFRPHAGGVPPLAAVLPPRGVPGRDLPG